MKSKLAAAIVVCMLGPVGLYFCLSGCVDKKLVEPGEPKDYPIYFWDGANDNWYFKYHPATNKVDSFYLPIAARTHFKVSADGKRLYIGMRNTTNVISLDSLTIINEIPYKGSIAISPDNRLIAICDDDLYVVKTSDYSVFYHDTISAKNGKFSSDGKGLYCVVPDSNDWRRHILKIDLYNNFAKTKIPVPEYLGMLVSFIPANDETKLYLSFSRGSFTSLFAVYDLPSDSVIFGHILSPGSGRYVQTPDGRYVFYTNPGTLLTGPPPPSEFYAYDVENNDLIVISTKGVVEGPLEDWLPMGVLAVTPDGRWLAAAHSGGFDEIIALDIKAMEITKYIEIGQPRMFIGFTCQYQR